MKASINWLKEFVAFSVSPSEIAHALTMAGLEVEGIEPFEGDYILEINVTPNRPDCLSIIGIAREISAILGLTLTQKAVPLLKGEGEGPCIEVKDTLLCQRYSSRVIKGVKVGQSPEWISKRLELHGFRSVNNIVDITNYVLLETGHPLHAFDFDKLAGNCIVVKTAGSIDRFLTIDNKEKKLNNEMLLIWDAEKPIAIAGVMGGLNSEVTTSAVNILLESAYFNPISIRRTSKSLNQSTESSYRFERGMDINNIVSALNRAAQLIVDIAGGKVSQLVDIYPIPFSAHPISVKPKKINTIMSIEIELSHIERLLKSIGFEVKKSGEEIFVTPPSFRHDIQQEMDVIEEIARLYGYNNIPSTLPLVEMRHSAENIQWNFIKKIKASMKASGFYEVINYSFLNPLVLDKLRLSDDDIRRRLVYIKNPLRKEDEALRTTLIPTLLENVRLNISRGEKSLRLFEISNIFLRADEGLPHERMRMTAVYLDDRKEHLWHSKHDRFYDLKGAVENLFIELRIKDYSFIQDLSLIEPYMHHGKSSIIKIGNEMVGSVGALRPEVLQAFEIDSVVNILEIDINNIFSFVSEKIKYCPIPKYPYIERDISIIVPEDITNKDAKEVILGIDSDLIESVHLFDVYTGKPIPPGKKSIAFSIRYRAGDRTLTDSEVNQLHSKILCRLEAELKAEVRG